MEELREGRRVLRMREEGMKEGRNMGGQEGPAMPVAVEKSQMISIEKHPLSFDSLETDCFSEWFH